MKARLPPQIQIMYWVCTRSIWALTLMYERNIEYHVFAKLSMRGWLIDSWRSWRSYRVHQIRRLILCWRCLLNVIKVNNFIWKKIHNRLETFQNRIFQGKLGIRLAYDGRKYFRKYFPHAHFVTTLPTIGLTCRWSRRRRHHNTWLIIDQWPSNSVGSGASEKVSRNVITPIVRAEVRATLKVDKYSAKWAR